VDRLRGPAESKERLRVLLATLTGELTLKQACQRLGVGETRLLQLREQALQGALGALLPAPRGRPRQEPAPDPQREALLEERIHELEYEVCVERVRTEIALTEPKLLRRAAAKKKRPVTPIPTLARRAERRCWRHVQRVREIVQMEQPPVRQRREPPPRRRGLPGQKKRRRVERRVRRTTLACRRLAQRHGQPLVTLAASLGISPRSLRRWWQGWRRDGLAPRPRGRPPQHATRAERQDVLALFRDVGPHVGLPTLRRTFPAIARGELLELQRRYRRAWRRHRRLLLYLLHWRRAGAVWAMDFSEPPAPIDGQFKRLLLVRDLASGCQLAALPTRGEDGHVLRRLLDTLVAWHGVPLVLKSDNGSAFIADATRAWAVSHQVLQLYSPPSTPEYNGAVEAGIGSLKTHAHYAATGAGRPAGHWTCDDIEAAAQQANEMALPHGPHGPTPQEAWRQRPTIARDERDALRRTYRRRYALECSQRGLPWSVALQRNVKASVDRVAISQALIEHGYLAIRRKRITDYVRECKERGLEATVEIQRETKASIDRTAIRRALLDHGHLIIRRRRITLPNKRKELAKITC
jgi:transposase InsO family protein